MGILPKCGNKESGPSTNRCYGISRGAVTVTVIGPTMYSDIEDLIESQQPDKTMHEWEQSTIEAEPYNQTSDGRRPDSPRSFHGLWD